MKLVARLAGIALGTLAWVVVWNTPLRAEASATLQVRPDLAMFVVSLAALVAAIHWRLSVKVIDVREDESWWSDVRGQRR